MKTPKPITAEEFDRMFDAGEDITEYLDLGRKVRYAPGVKPAPEGIGSPGFWLDFESGKGTDDRKRDNAALLGVLQTLAELYPDLRFNQLLAGFGFIVDGQDDFFTEPGDVLKRVQEAISKL